MKRTVRRAIPCGLAFVGAAVLGLSALVRPGHENDNVRSYGEMFVDVADKLDEFDGRGGSQ